MPRLLEAWTRDLARAARTLLRAPGFAAVAALTLALGIGAALALTRFLRTLLFGVAAMDATVLVAVAALMVGVAVLASYVPARRASAVDPVEAIRTE